MLLKDPLLGEQSITEHIRSLMLEQSKNQYYSNVQNYIVAETQQIISEKSNVSMLDLLSDNRLVWNVNCGQVIINWHKCQIQLLQDPVYSWWCQFILQSFLNIIRPFEKCPPLLLWLYHHQSGK